MNHCVKIALILCSINLSAQNLLYNSGGMSYVYTEITDYFTVYDNIDSLPDTLRVKSNRILENQTGEFSSRMTFSWGNAIDLNNYFKAYPEKLNQNNTIVPSYSMIYSFADSSLGISRYDFMLWLDSFGQVIKLTFPHEYDFQAYEFLPLDEAKRKADSALVHENFNYNKFNYRLKYDELVNDLLWDITYSNDDTDTNGDEITLLLSFEISTRTHQIISTKIDSSSLPPLPLIDLEELKKEEQF